MADKHGGREQWNWIDLKKDFTDLATFTIQHFSSFANNYNLIVRNSFKKELEIYS